MNSRSPDPGSVTQAPARTRAGSVLAALLLATGFASAARAVAGGGGDAGGPPFAAAVAGAAGPDIAVAAGRSDAELSEGAAPASACPGDMVLVSGDYCPDVRHTCTRWLDDPKLPYARCAEYAEAARCVARRVHKTFCIDRDEYTPEGHEIPLNHSSFVTASRICGDLGKRICTESEWNFACEGEEMRPYPYGWKREPVCNQDREDLYTKTPRGRIMNDLRRPSAELVECVSPFGVRNMVGNMDEPVLREETRHNYPFRNALKGGWWMSARNRCRPATTAHDDHYEDVQVGVRCCADVPGEPGTPNG
ncbi:MAG: SUMF1/EgtB/PvdO family nonheme iron enzyme [Polyangiaceae bacterium]|nr:SUMF1/EgtB/PvdO family nonheme iron enzyme [Polyangiaceae bacterium]